MPRYGSPFKINPSVEYVPSYVDQEKRIRGRKSLKRSPLNAMSCKEKMDIIYMYIQNEFTSQKKDKLTFPSLPINFVYEILWCWAFYCDSQVNMSVSCGVFVLTLQQFFWVILQLKILVGFTAKRCNNNTMHSRYSLPVEKDDRTIGQIILKESAVSCIQLTVGAVFNLSKLKALSYSKAVWIASKLTW